jgi:hypothetical protein
MLHWDHQLFLDGPEMVETPVASFGRVLCVPVLLLLECMTASQLCFLFIWYICLCFTRINSLISRTMNAANLGGQLGSLGNFTSIITM